MSATYMAVHFPGLKDEEKEEEEEEEEEEEAKDS